MKKIANYIIREKVTGNSFWSMYRASGSEDNERYLLKMPNENVNSGPDAAGLAREYKLACDLKGGTFITPVKRETSAGVCIMVYENIEGVALRTLVGARRIEVSD
jgi:hypothetical protein